MKEHMKKAHNSVVQTIMTSVVNFLSPQQNKEASNDINISSPKELFVDNESDDDALNEAVEDMELLQAGVRQDSIEAPMIPIVPENGCLNNTMPAGDLSRALGQVHNQNKVAEATNKTIRNSLTCVECHIGRETNREQDRRLKAQAQKS